MAGNRILLSHNGQMEVTGGQSSMQSKIGCIPKIEVGSQFPSQTRSLEEGMSQLSDRRRG